MATLDIRDKQAEETTSIQFDDSQNQLQEASADKILFVHPGGNRYLCDMCNIDDFIAALKKAKELWGK
jgi:hypothetical protein